MGKPTAFVDLTGCPLGCWYCDTIYAFVGGDHLLLNTMLQEVKRYQCSPGDSDLWRTAGLTEFSAADEVAMQWGFDFSH